MTSWSMQNQYQEPVRRSSRSRSPRRRDRDGGHPESAHDLSSTHSGYGQDRGWDDYYDRRGRGRSRSPGDDSGRKRRRSHSPYERDRFDPRPRYGDDYDTHSRSHGYSSPRSRNGAHYPPYQHHSPTMSRSSNRPPPMDPYLYQPQAANLRQYAEWFRATYPKEAKEEDEADRAAEKEAGRKTRDGIRARWEKYKKKHLSMQLQTLFDHHKASPWFSEKYNPAPEWINLRNRVRKQGWKGRPELFLRELEEGKYDQRREFESVGKDNTIPTDEKAQPQPEDIDVPDEDGAEPGIETQTKNETNGKQSAQNGRQAREDDVPVQPDGNQIAIRTIPPDIGRQKIEEACRSIPGFVHLALGDPLQKRQYYRAGWLKFNDDTDVANTITLIGEKKIDGFKLHVSHVSRPYYGRLRQAPTTSQRIEKDLQQVKQLASILEDEYAALQVMKSGAPEPKPEEAKKDGDQDVSMTEGQQPVSTSEVENTELEQDIDIEPLERGSEAVERRIEKLAIDLLTQQDSGEGDGDSNFDLNKSILALDLYVAYIRAAYNTCYYCAAVCDHVEELNRKCPKHVYPGADETTDQKDDEDRLAKDQTKEKDRKEKHDDVRKMEMLDSKIALLINRPGIDPADYGGKNPDEELRKAVEPHIKQEDEGKFRCRTCTKLFKASSFVEKHILNKHSELVKQLDELDELPFFNNFALDPNRVQPFTHLPPAVGNNIPNPQAYGLQAPPPVPYPMDYGRPPVPGFYGGYPPPPGAYPPYGAPPMYEYYLPPGHWQAPQGRKDDHASGRRLQERMGGYASTTHLTLTGVEGLPPKPVAAIESSGHETGGGGSGGGGGGGGERTGGSGGRRRGRASTGGPPPPPPADAKEDPRAAAGRKVSYHDMDDVAEGDVELTY
ncbi:hypothetical protein Clacol_001884 [Clathrus columnatus]|uniref:C2H2-type domain-containing protein n=1 Tax=Clathrus columnatus TaxID=1419009 RepID=A0AAV4ZZA7_9AGAM|nr:hypothetical protein Clacol_001884 [Clathrus columnatus]